MRRVAFSIASAIALVVLVACGTSKSAASSSVSLTGRTWFIVSVRVEHVNNLFDARSPQITFVGERVVEKVAGNGGCNALSGSVSLDGSELRFGPMASTRMMCEQAPLENRILKAFADVRSYAVDGERLLLMGERADTVLICQAAELR